MLDYCEHLAADMLNDALCIAGAFIKVEFYHVSH
jgi:hypothetical protein